MSRIGKQPILMPEGVSVEVDGTGVGVKGPRGELFLAVRPEVIVKVEGGKILCELQETEIKDKRQAKRARALWGTYRSRLANMVHGVTEGWQKKLELRGVGYKAMIKGNNLELFVGLSHSVLIEAPKGIQFSVDQETLTVEGIDNVLVGQVASDIRSVRKPEPYKGKGIRYVGEQVRRKVGKVVGVTE